MKKSIGCVVVIALILVLGVWSAWSDYTWQQRVTTPYQDAGWVVVDRQANYVDPIHPWTIFKCPVVRVALVHPDSVVRVLDSLVVTNVLWIDHKGLDETVVDAFPFIFDCIRKRCAFVDTLKLATDLDWRELSNSADSNTFRMLCASSQP